MFPPSIMVKKLIIFRHINTSVGKKKPALQREKGLYKNKKTPLL